MAFSAEYNAKMLETAGFSVVGGLILIAILRLFVALKLFHVFTVIKILKGC